MLPDYPSKPNFWATMLQLVSEWAVFGAKGLPHPGLKDKGKAARMLRPAMMFQLLMILDLLKESLKRCPEDFAPATVLSLHRIAIDIDRHVVVHNDYDGSKPFIESCMQELVDLKIPRDIDAYLAGQSTGNKPDSDELLQRLIEVLEGEVPPAGGAGSESAVEAVIPPKVETVKDGPDIANGVVRHGDRTAKVEPQSMKLLVALWPNKVLTLASAEELAWGAGEYEENRVRSAISDINKALRTIGMQKEIVRPRNTGQIGLYDRPTENL
jgi:hypothetical protein